MSFQNDKQKFYIKKIKIAQSSRILGEYVKWDKLQKRFLIQSFGYLDFSIVLVNAF